MSAQNVGNEEPPLEIERRPAEAQNGDSFQLSPLVYHPLLFDILSVLCILLLLSASCVRLRSTVYALALFSYIRSVERSSSTEEYMPY